MSIEITNFIHGERVAAAEGAMAAIHVHKSLIPEAQRA